MREHGIVTGYFNGQRVEKIKAQVLMNCMYIAAEGQIAKHKKGKLVMKSFMELHARCFDRFLLL